MAPKPPEIDVVSIAFHRNENLIEVDTTVRNLGPKSIQGVTAIYHFFTVGHLPVTTQRTKVDDPALEPGAESTIHAQLEAPARAVSVEFAAVDSHGRELRVRNTGPFPIE